MGEACIASVSNSLFKISLMSAVLVGQKKIFGGIAKTKEEIRLEQHRELAAQAHGKEVESGKHIVAGQRPLYILAKKKDEHA